MAEQIDVSAYTNEAGKLTLGAVAMLIGDNTTADDDVAEEIARAIFAAGLDENGPACAICGRSGAVEPLVSSYIGDVHESCGLRAMAEGGIVF